MKAVFTLLSGKKLDKNAFIHYLDKKINKTARHFKLKPGKDKIYCLDDAAIDIIYALMSHGKQKIRKSAFLFCLKKELELFAGLKGLNFNFQKYSGLKLKISEMLDELEKKHPEIKYSIVHADEQLQTID